MVRSGWSALALALLLAPLGRALAEAPPEDACDAAPAGGRAGGRATRLRVTTPGDGAAKEVLFAGVPATNIAERAENAARSPTLGPWVDLRLADGVAKVRSYTPPQIAHDAARQSASLQGWVRVDSDKDVGDEIFAIPDEAALARPYRPEPWRVSMKGVERAILLGKDGVARATLSIARGTWVPLVGFGYNTAQLG